jgi:hypothetical protein
MVIRSGQTKQCNRLCGLSSVPPGTSEAEPRHLGVPKATFEILGQSVPNRDCPGKTGTVGQLAHDVRGPKSGKITTMHTLSKLP